MTKSSSANYTITKQSGGGFGPFYAQFVQPWLTEIEVIRSQVIMQPYAWNGVGNFGYDPNVGLYGGGAIEASPAIGVSAGGTRAYIIADNNHEGAAATDYFNAQAGVTTTILQHVRNAYASPNWYSCGGCTQPFTRVIYPTPTNPGSFGGRINRWEAALGNSSPYYAALVNGTYNVGGIGQACGTGGQVTWQLASPTATAPLNPPMVTVMPGGPISPTGGLEEAVFQIMVLFLRNNSTWKSAYQNALNQYPFNAPRDLYHFIRLTMLTAAWATSYSFTPPLGVSSTKQAFINALQQAFTSTSSTGPLGHLGCYGGARGMSQNWGTPDHRPEANMQTMAMMDPNGPAYFGTNGAS